MRFWRFVSIVLRKPRVVLDTNVLISASIAEQGYSAAILRAARQRRLLLLVSPYIIQEYAAVMQRPHIIRKYQGIEGRVEALVRYLNAYAILVEPQTIERVVLDDPKDDAILACALAGQAHYVVSGDDHLQRLGAFRGIKILAPRDFATQVLHLSRS